MKYWRFGLLFCCMAMLAAILIVRLFYLQIVQGKFYQSQALGQQLGFAEVQGERGEVFFKNSKETKGLEGTGEVKSLAINKDTWIISAVPKIIKDKTVFVNKVSEILQDSPQLISAKLEESQTYVILKKAGTKEEMQTLANLNLDGLGFEKVPARYYPQASLASQVIGFVGGMGTGQYGIEGYYNDVLKGKNGIREDKRGFDVIDADTSEEYLHGTDLYLTIDYNIQFQAESLLQEAKQSIDIDSGQIIVLQPNTGRVLALANFAPFDPNQYSKETNFGVFQNGAVQKIFEPGSVFKPFTMAMALEEGKVTPESTFNDTGSLKIGKDTIYNFAHEKYDMRNMSGILEKSINTGAAYLSQLVGKETFFDYINKLGLNDKTEIDLQGEVSSKNEALRTGSDFTYATASFGQGIEMTPIQLVKAFSIFANGGKMVKPYMVENMIHGTEETPTKPQISEQIISPKTASDVTKMMINVVEKGFGDAAKVKGYYMAGKTGTAEVPYETKKGYYPDRTVQSFIGYGPALAPQFLILVKLDNPKVPKSSLSAAPIFKKLAQYIINYWQIAPDY